MGCLKITENTGAIRLGKNHFFLGDTYEKKEVPQNFCNDYYPFGLSFNSYTRAAITDQNFKFNAGSELESMTDWYSTPFRKYDPSIGRFHGVDALASMYSSWSPSQFGLNNPVMRNDPTGLKERSPIDEAKRGSACGTCFQPEQSYGYNDGMSALAGHGNWSDYVYASAGAGLAGFVRNARLMSNSFFEGFYGKSKDQARADAAKAEASKNGNHYELKLESETANYTQVSNGEGNSPGLLTSVTYNYSLVQANGGSDFSTELSILSPFLEMSGDVIYNGKNWLGKNGQTLSSDWGGNKFTGARNSAIKISGSLKFGGKFLGHYGTALAINNLPSNPSLSDITQVGAPAAAGAALGGWFGLGVGAFVGGIDYVIDNVSRTMVEMNRYVEQNFVHPGVAFFGGYSDQNLKENIVPLDSTLQKVMLLQAFMYEWKTKDYPEFNFKEGQDIGLLAQEVERVFPELVEEDEQGYKMIAYYKLIPVLIEAIKEQQIIINKQSEDIQQYDGLMLKHSEFERRLRQIEESTTH